MENLEGQKQFFITLLAAYWTQQKLQLLKTHFQNKNNNSKLISVSLEV